MTHIVPVFEGHSDPHQIKRLNVAGDHVTQRLADLLYMRGYSVSSAHMASGALQRLKESCCYVAVDYAQELEVLARPDCEVQPIFNCLLPIPASVMHCQRP